MVSTAHVTLGCSTTTLGIHTGLTIHSSGTILGTGTPLGYIPHGTGMILGTTEATTDGILLIIMEEDITSDIMDGDTATTATLL